MGASWPYCFIGARAHTHTRACAETVHYASLTAQKEVAGGQTVFSETAVLCRRLQSQRYTVLPAPLTWAGAQRRRRRKRGPRMETVVGNKKGWQRGRGDEVGKSSWRWVCRREEEEKKWETEKEREPFDSWLWSFSLKSRQGEEAVCQERGGLFVREDVFPQMRCVHGAVCERACYGWVFACNLHRQIPLQPKQQRIAEKKEKPSSSKSNCSWRKERRQRGGGGGAERRRKRRCKLSEGLQGVLAEHDCWLGACACVCGCAVTSPREFRAKQHQRRCFGNGTRAANKERVWTAAPTPGKHQTPRLTRFRIIGRKWTRRTADQSFI